ncbi:DUF4942 domain-containing protein [Serratia proteamaculans]|uniref:DUF4942 domain-containing protein n=1 Tax=Serratia proteamaculans TaxID=28151 RepID=UPI0039B0556D
MLTAMMQKTHSEVTADIGVEPTHSGEVIPSVAIDQILGARKQGLEIYRQAVGLLNEAKTLLNCAAGGSVYGFTTVLNDAVRRGDVTDNSQLLEREVDAKIWDRLMNETGMYTFMSSSQRDEWDKQRHSDKMPAVTLDTVLATFEHLHNNKQATFEQGVIDVFLSLSWDYKTNNPCRLGKKIILDCMLDGLKYRHPSVSLRGRDRIDDLAKVCALLDKGHIPDHRIGVGANFAEWFRDANWNSVFNCDYFTLRVFKKGSCHLVFSRPDLVVQLNDIVSRRYPDMLPARV